MTGFATVAGLTLLAKVVSFFKDATVAHQFGVSHELDAFLLAFGLHTFLAGMLANGLPSAMLPAYLELRHQSGEAAADRLGVQSALCHAATLFVVCVAVAIFGDGIVNVMGRGFQPENQVLAKRLLHHLMPFLYFYGMTAQLGMWLRGRKHFMVAAAAPILTPLVIIAILIGTGRSVSVDVLVMATNIGAVLHFSVMLISILRFLPAPGMGWWRSIKVWEPANIPVLKSSGPFLVAGLVLGAAALVDQAMAGWLQEGSVTVLSYSDKVCGILLALTAMAASEALFPFFADLVAKQDWHSLRRQMLQTLLLVAAFSVPLTLLLSWQAPLIVKLLFERGQFGPHDTEHVAAVLRFAALQIPFYITGVLLSRVVVSLQARWFTLGLAALCLSLNVALNLFFMKRLGVAGIALSTVFVYFTSAAVMYAYVFRAIRQRIQNPA